MDGDETRIAELRDDAFQVGHRVEAVRVVDPYRPSRRCKYRALPGNKYVLITVAIHNTGLMPVVASFSDFRLETDKGRKYAPMVMPDLEDDFGAARIPAPGESDSGTLLFEVPLIASLACLWEQIDAVAGRVELPGLVKEAVA